MIKDEYVPRPFSHWIIFTNDKTYANIYYIMYIQKEGHKKCDYTPYRKNIFITRTTCYWNINSQKQNTLMICCAKNGAKRAFFKARLHHRWKHIVNILLLVLRAVEILIKQYTSLWLLVIYLFHWLSTSHIDLYYKIEWREGWNNFLLLRGFESI